MKAKLVKEYGDFYLVSDKEIQKGDEYVKLDNRPRMLLLGTTIASAKVSKLSLKNCQAIERGYDLDELASDIDSEKVRWSTEESLEHFGYMIGIKDGFQKALELMKHRLVEETEWDVEIEMICPHPIDTYRCGIKYGCDEDGCNHPEQVPYLDADGCLILKRK